MNNFIASHVLGSIMLACFCIAAAIALGCG